MMMIRGSKEAVDSSTNEGSSTSDGKINKTSSSSWLRLKDPRIVRVSRAFGGKDRHSKVCTIRGLRDRRVRLSVPTAIQLYELQDRLGLNQPSKVVDWLLNAAKHEIDELPPLPVSPGSFSLNHHHEMLSSREVGASPSNQEGLQRSNIWSSNDSLWRGKSKEAAVRETMTNEGEKQVIIGDGEGEDSSINNSLFPVVSSGGGGTSYFQLETSNFPLSQLGSHGLNMTSQTTTTTDMMMNLHNSFNNNADNFRNSAQYASFSVVPLPSGSQLLVCPPGTTTQPLFPANSGHVAASVEMDPRQINHFQMLSSNHPHHHHHNMFSSNPLAQPNHLHSINSQSIRPFHFTMTPTSLFPSHNSSTTHDSPSDKNQEFPSK